MLFICNRRPVFNTVFSRCPVGVLSGEKAQNYQRKDKRQFYGRTGQGRKKKRPIKTGFCRSKQLWFKASACCCKGMSSVTFFLNCNSHLRFSKFNLPSSQRPVPLTHFRQVDTGTCVISLIFRQDRPSARRSTTLLRSSSQ